MKAKIAVDKMEVRKSREELQMEAFNKYQQKVLKPLQKRLKELEGEIMASASFEVERELEAEKKAINEMIRLITGQPKIYDDRPDQQIYHELLDGLYSVVEREVGKHQFKETEYESKVGYISTSWEVFGRVSRTLPTSWGEYWHIQDICSKIVDKIKEVKNDYPDLYK